MSYFRNFKTLLFNSIQYLIFLPIVAVLYYLTVPRLRWIVLFLASCLFYMYFIPKYILCLFFLILVDFYAAKKIDAATGLRRRKWLLLLSLISNFGLLIYFKYLGFFTENFNLAFHTQLKLPDEILPIGLSFHTFQSVSYVVDVYRKKIKPETHLGLYSTYVLFFPQMVAGPIERYTGLGMELKKESRFQLAFLKKAVPLILTGLFYKMVIADNCGDYVNYTYQNLSTQHQLNVVLAIFLFCVQIYSDFFGYSLVAQGSAKIFGIHLIDNFAFPFFSENIVVFWKKWHISLTSWFREYVYISMGGSRTTTFKHTVNIATVFVLSGLWHGAGYNFILWGFLHAVCYLITYFILKAYRLKFPAVLSCLFTFSLVSFIFVFFRTGTFSESIHILTAAFQSSGEKTFLPVSHFLLANIAVLLGLEYFAKEHGNYSRFFENNSFRPVIYSYLMFAILTFSGIANLPFIYFQF